MNPFNSLLIEQKIIVAKKRGDFIEVGRLQAECDNNKNNKNDKLFGENPFGDIFPDMFGSTNKYLFNQNKNK